MSYDESEIKPILKVADTRDMTVGELKKALESFPDDRKIRVAVEDETGNFMRASFELKKVSPIVDMDTNMVHALLTISKIKIEVVYDGT